jgi:hypothetical protein
MIRPFIVLSGIAAALVVGSAALAIGLDDFTADLEADGFTVTAGDPVSYGDLSVDGVPMAIERDGKSAEIELLDYGTNAALKEDWSAVSGEGPAPIAATTDFDGRILYWNNDSVLAIDLSAPNDAPLARIAANIYLGLPGAGGAEPGTLPPTGGPPPVESGPGLLGLSLLLAGAAFVLAGPTLVVRSVRRP